MDNGKKKVKHSNYDLDDTMENCTPGERNGGASRTYKDMMFEMNKNDTITDSVNESTMLRSKNMNFIENSPANSML